MEVLGIIVNYRSAGLCRACLLSLSADAPDLGNGVRFIVADNDSPDNSADVIDQAIREHNWAPWCRLVRLKRNGGFAFGNNSALPQIKELPNYVLLLNPDTIVRPGAIARLAEFLDQHPKVGVAGSRLEDPDGTPQVSAFNFPTILSELESALRLGPITRLLSRWMIAPSVRDIPHRCDWVAGASMLIRREVFQEIGLLDEGYFMYYEEVDFCLRAARAGWECWYVPDSRVVHLVGQSSGVTDTKRPPRRLPAYWFESRQRYFRKNHGRAYSFAADAAWTIGYLIHKVDRFIRRKPHSDPPRLFGDFLMHAFARRKQS